jgi:adenine-specific DNA-methyltransferase
VFEVKVEIEKDLLKPLMTGGTIARYSSNFNNIYILYTYNVIDNETVVLEEQELEKKYPKAYNYLVKLKKRLSSRGSTSMKYPRWYSLWNQRQIQRLTSSKILTPAVCYKGSM